MNKMIWLPILLFGCADGGAQDREDKVADEVQQRETKPLAIEDDEIDVHMRVMAPESDATIKKRAQKNNKIYQKQLETAPTYKSDIRSHLIENKGDYSWAGIFVHGLRGENHEFRCIHDPQIINRAELDGWELVECGQNSVMFLRKIDNRISQCEKRPKVQEVYHALEFTIRNASSPFRNSVDLTEGEYIQKNRKSLVAEFERPTREEAQISHPQIQKFYPKISADELEYVIPKVFHGGMIVFSDSFNLQSMRFWDTTNKKCERNARGWQYTEQGYFMLDTPSSSYQDMSKQLLKLKTYVR